MVEENLIATKIPLDSRSTVMSTVEKLRIASTWTPIRILPLDLKRRTCRQLPTGIGNRLLYKPIFTGGRLLTNPALFRRSSAIAISRISLSFV